MSSNSNTALATQQSIKSYVDASVIPAGDPIMKSNIIIVEYLGHHLNLYGIDVNNRLGIGTNTPSHSLHIRKAASDKSVEVCSQHP